MRLNASTFSMIMKPGASTSQGAVKMAVRSAEIMRPHSGMAGSPPRPTKLRAASSSTAVAIDSVACTTNGVRALGSTRCVTSRLDGTPSARSAVTKSCSLIESTLDRTNRV